MTSTNAPEECDAEIERALAELNAEKSPPTAPNPKAHHSTFTNAVNFDICASLYQLTGVDLTQIHGLGPYLALRLIGECGTDMSRWQTAKHFTSWLSVVSRLEDQRRQGAVRPHSKDDHRVGALRRLAAVTVGRTDTALGAFYRRLAARVGKAKAVTATARKIAVLFYNAMRYGMGYKTPEPSPTSTDIGSASSSSSSPGSRVRVYPAGG